MTIHITVYRGAAQPAPIAQEDFATWPDLADELEAMARTEPTAPATASPEAQKKTLLAFGPHRLSKPYRCAANVDAVTLLVIDIDRIDDLDTLLEHVEALGSPALVYASPSDTPEARRVRVVAPMSHELAPAECRGARLRFAEVLGLAPGCGVEGAIEASKLFFAGRLHGTPARKVWRFGE